MSGYPAAYRAGAVAAGYLGSGLSKLPRLPSLPPTPGNIGVLVGAIMFGALLSSLKNPHDEGVGGKYAGPAPIAGNGGQGGVMELPPLVPRDLGEGEM